MCVFPKITENVRIIQENETISIDFIEFLSSLSTDSEKPE